MTVRWADGQIAFQLYIVDILDILKIKDLKTTNRDRKKQINKI